MTALFDTHCHLQDAAFAGELGAVLHRAEDAGVIGITLCGYDAASNAEALEIASRSSIVYPAVGYHPHEADGVGAAQLAELESLAALPQVIAIGEIGLDFFRWNSAEAAQRRLFDAQLDLAARLDKPVSVHSRGAEAAAYEHLARYSAGRGWHAGEPPVGVMHCFGGSAAQAEAYVALGFVISIACPVTYPANHEARKMALDLPLESLVVETDSPYLPPQAFRGQRNEPAHVRYAVEAIAAVRGMPLTAVAEATASNAACVFGVPLPAGTAAW